MTDATRAIVDYAEQGQATEMRSAFYSELQNKIMSHIEDQKIRVAQTMFNQQPDPLATVEDEDITQEQ
jgi:hypothetical protein